jgi:hypothetical protein
MYSQNNLPVYEPIHRNWSACVVFSSGLTLQTDVSLDDMKEFLKNSRKGDCVEKVKPIDKWVMLLAFRRAMKYFPSLTISKMTFSKIN